MPRRAPTQIIEHRLSLSDYERTALKEWLAERQRIERLNAGSRGVASVGAVASSGLALWMLAGYLAMDIVPDVVDKVVSAVTVMQEKCPKAIAAADTKIANYEARINIAEDAGGDARFIAAERKRLDTLKDRRNSLAELCEWATIGQDYDRLDSGSRPGIMEIWTKVFGSGL